MAEQPIQGTNGVRKISGDQGDVLHFFHLLAL